MAEETIQKLKEILKSIGKRNVDISNDLVKESILDSIETIDFLIMVEKEFNLKITEEDYNKKLSLLSNLVDYIESNQNK
jgi:acyl carrier protein